MQRQAGIWITGSFRTSPTGGIESLAGLLPIHLLLKRLVDRSCLRVPTLSLSHPIRPLLTNFFLGSIPSHPLGLARLPQSASFKLKSPLQDIILTASLPTEVFAPCHSDNSPGSRLLDLFPGRISTYRAPNPGSDDYSKYVSNLDTLLTTFKSDPKVAFVACGSFISHQSSGAQSVATSFVFHQNAEVA